MVQREYINAIFISEQKSQMAEKMSSKDIIPFSSLE